MNIFFCSGENNQKRRVFDSVCGRLWAYRAKCGSTMAFEMCVAGTKVSLGVREALQLSMALQQYAGDVLDGKTE